MSPRSSQAGVGGRGERRILGYSYERQTLHTTRFVEQGSQYEQELGVARGRRCRRVKAVHPRPATCGEIRFTPAPGPAGVRHIYAITTMHGQITRRQLVATYRAPSEPEPSKVPSLRVRRLANGLSISWSGSRAAIRAAMPVAYNVDVNLTDGRRLLAVVGRGHHHVTIPNVDSAVGARVLVGPMRNDDTQGRTRAVTLRPRARAASG